MWSLGVLLFTMISGQFPFYDSIPQELFRKIKNGRFALPKDVGISMETEFLLRQLIELDPRKRLTASAAVDATQNVLSRM
jgi:serine/threonine-protein kinase 40